MDSVQINSRAVLVAGLSAVVMGGTWYSPLMFGSAWMVVTGKTNEQIENGFTPLQIPAAFAASFVVATVLSIVIDWANTGSAAGGALIGGGIALGVTTVLTGVDYFFEHRPVRLFIITTAHAVVSLTVIGTIAGGWQ